MSAQPALTEEFCVAIGRVMVNFSMLELAVGEAVAGLTRMPAPSDIWPPEDTGSEDDRIVGEILTSGSSFKRNVEMFACLQKLRHPAHDEAAFNALLKTLFELEEERNLVVHSFWSGGEDGKAERHKITSRSKGHKVQKVIVPVEDLQRLAERVGEACGLLLPYMFGGKPNSVATGLVS